MLFYLTLLAPVVVVVALIAVWRRRRSGAARWLVGFAALGGIAGSALYVFLILRQTSSTAAIGIIFVPLIFAVAAVAGGLCGWSLYQVVHTAEALRAGWRGVVPWLVATVFLVVAVYSTITLTRDLVTFQQLKSPQADARFLEQRYRTAMAAKNYFQLSAIAANPNTPPAVLLEIARSPDPGLHEKRQGLTTMFDRDALAVVRKVLRNPNMPPEALVDLARSKNDYVLGDVAASKHATEPILRGIAGRSDSYLVRWGLATNRNTPRDILERLAKDGDRVTAQQLAQNPSAPRPILAELAGHADEFVRRNVARNPSIDAATMERLAGDPNEMVRFYLSINTALTPEVLTTLTRDPSERVRRYAGEQLGRKGR